MRSLIRTCYVAICLASALFVHCIKELVDDRWILDHRTYGLLTCSLLALLLALYVVFRLCRTSTAPGGVAGLRFHMRLLPFGGESPKLTPMTACLTGACSVLAHLGEHHTLIPHGELLMSFLTALVMATIAAVLSYFLFRTLRAVVAFIIAAFCTFIAATAPLRSFVQTAFFGHPYEKWPAPLFNRPPPLPQLH